MTLPFVSFAQNFEDVMLWRALKHVDSGFYFDVGAYLPVEDSVTEAFYQRGWHGINIEPHPFYLAELMRARPRDINLGIAIGDSPGEVTMAFVTGTGLSTLDPDEAARRATEGRALTHASVQVETLATVWSTHIPDGQPVHFMKIDVEGFERHVILSNDWAKNRPWIIVVEATDPTTAEPSFAAWESVLTVSEYAFVYFDGLNRFYVAHEHSYLDVAFQSPPNIFDNFVQASAKRAELVADFAHWAAAAEERAVRAQAALSQMQASRSWRMTRPLRTAAGWIRRRAERGSS